MTTTVSAADAPAVEAVDQRRLLAISVNLLPVEITAARQGRRFRRVLIVALIAVITIVAAWYVHERSMAAAAGADVRSAQQDAAVVKSQQGQFADLQDTIAKTTAIESQLSTLMQGDLSWYKLLPALRAAAPSGIAITGVTGSVTVAAAGASAASPSASTTAAVVGTLTVTGTGPDPATVAEYADALGNVPGLTGQFVNSVTAQGGPLTYNITLQITAAAAGTRYATSTSTAPAPTATSTGHS